MVFVLGHERVVFGGLFRLRFFDFQLAFEFALNVLNARQVKLRVLEVLLCVFALRLEA
jgi:hypothetical protein